MSTLTLVRAELDTAETELADLFGADDLYGHYLYALDRLRSAVGRLLTSPAEPSVVAAVRAAVALAVVTEEQDRVEIAEWRAEIAQTQTRGAVVREVAR